MQVSVYSEIGELKDVLVHFPGYEHRKILPWNMTAMLFDDVLDVEDAHPEHDHFVTLLRNNGVRVHYLTNLLSDVFAKDCENIVKEVLVEEELVEMFFREKLECNRLILGYPDCLSPRYPKIITPLPNLYFTRDPAFVIHDTIFIANPARPARRREARLLKAIFTRHPEFEGNKIYAELLDTDATVEGGDVHVIDDGSVIIGVGERTNEKGAAKIREYLFTNTTIDKVFVINIPASREFMHLDTVMTFVDRKQILTLPYIWDKPEYYKKIAEIAKKQCEEMKKPNNDLKPEYFDAKGKLRVYRSGADEPETYDNVIEGLAKYDKVDPHLTLYVAGRLAMYPDPYEHIAEALREQWNDAANALALRPGWVFTYTRNDRTLRSLEYASLRTLAFSGGELVRGRGGARCMSMPLVREKLF